MSGAGAGGRESSRVMEKFHILSVVVITRVFTFTKTHQAIHFIWVYFMVHKLKLPRQQRKESMKQKMEEHVQKKQLLVSPCPSAGE